MRKINAQIIADSVNPQGDRITSYILTYPRFIHAELMTHRMFSRNSASSRAIPFEKMMKSVEEDPFYPIAWQKDHKGMQGIEYHTDPEQIEYFKATWLMSGQCMTSMALALNHVGQLTKQLCNRLLEPFLWHTVLVTATEYDNFFDLRCPRYSPFEDHSEIFKSKKDLLKKHPVFAGLKDGSIVDWFNINNSQAEIHMQALAEAMWDQFQDSKPILLKEGQFHLPFIEIEED
jgi:hypothetical protein